MNKTTSLLAHDRLLGKEHALSSTDMKSHPLQLNFHNFNSVSARPFLKWAGGKSQLLKQIVPIFPPALASGEVHRYVEPFVGGGAVFFYVAQNYSLKEYILCDVNPELVIAYLTVQSLASDLINELYDIQKHYDRLDSQCRKQYYYEMRETYNHTRTNINFTKISKNWATRTAQMIFLNKTCFNGLYRVNSRGYFNVPFGDYKNPRILDADNLLACSMLLEKAEIYQQDFEDTYNLAEKGSMIYFDPPYRPVSATSSFTSYSQSDFNDKDQVRLARTFLKCHEAGSYLMLSNSDPTVLNPDDIFFEELYQGFVMHRVYASRMINSIASKRGNISELVITNYKVKNTIND